jgi:hypothetical protein
MPPPQGHRPSSPPPPSSPRRCAWRAGQSPSEEAAKTVRFTVLERHAEMSFDECDGTCIKTLDGSAGRNGGSAGLLVRAIRLRQRLHAEGENNAAPNDVESHNGLILVLIPSTVRWCQRASIRCCVAEWRERLWCDRRSLHHRQPSLIAMAAHLPVEPAKHARHVDGDGLRVRENFCVVWRRGGGAGDGMGGCL